MRGTRREALTLAVPGDRQASRTAGEIFDNVRSLGVSDLTLRYVDEAPGQSSQSADAVREPDTWVADVQVGWRIKGFDKNLSQMEVTFTFAETPDGTALVDAGGGENPAPLWLLTRLAIERSQRALVMVADSAQVDEYASLADQAVVDVRKVLPGWRGRLVIEVPESQTQLDNLLGTEPNTYDSIAAVTATVDGSAVPSAPTHIFVNPAVFGGLGEAGSQIVISHEATHVATEAATSSMAMWLLEGFADYVALAHVDFPVSVTASQILADVRKGGPPKQLPSGAEFDPSKSGLGASYESAWLACRFLAEEYGERRLIRFYNTVDDGTPMRRAFREVLRTDQRTFTREWRDYLRDLASDAWQGCPRERRRRARAFLPRANAGGHHGRGCGAHLRGPRCTRRALGLGSWGTSGPCDGQRCLHG